ncbi:threonine/homoserine/homoserine lactone efflux protein [Kribbella antiqua]|uniref:Threonine/homoserine/homoserine lactone efflux protein n=1 Tax=Kribbella antiqua TaxID=2512217 RepID=A0A4R2ICJ4_9ACTN|nr:LysE family translocator [Kribbella antiqua]TCO42274.1 threonine/homoserine/homoserine lactone efflux protein [Kribbella antiqua]
MELSIVLGFLVAVFLVSIVPGPDMLFIVANAAVGGRRAGVVAAAGMSTGLAVHTVAAALGLGALIQAAPQVLNGVRIAGAAFLLYLAYLTWRASRQEVGSVEPDVELPRRTLRRTYLLATLTNLANPKVILFFLAFVPQFLSTGAGSWPVTVQLLVLGAIFIAVGFPVDASAGLLAGSLTSKFLGAGGKVRRRLERVSAGVFAALAARLATDVR